MKTLAFAAFCAILSQCHARESALSRPKRTLRMLESLFGSMRDTFGPLTAPAMPAAQPPSEVILATKYPVGVKYALYPTVRMHIRPVQQHVIYMQSVPAIPGPVLHPVRPPLNTGAVEFLRPMPPPMVRLPKTQTTTTIHYEIIPLPVPVHSQPPSSPFSSSAYSSSGYSSSAYSSPSSAPPPPPPPSSSSFNYDETDDPSAPWSLDELPPPVPTSAPLNPLDEPNVPWNLHALPPPVATKQPRGNEAFGWPPRSGHQHSMDSGYSLPTVFDKKLVIPAQGVGSHNRHRGIFRPSPLQSEITVQPSVEVAAYSETQTLAQQPSEYVNRLRNLNSPRPQVFPHRNNRLRREAPPSYFIDGNRVVHMSPHGPAGARTATSVFASRRSNNARYEMAPSSRLQPSLTQPALIELRHNSANISWRPQTTNLHSESARQLLPNIGHDIRVSTSLSDPERYVLITPRPLNYTRQSHADPARAETGRVSGYAPGPQPQSSNLLRTSNDGEWKPRERAELSAFLDGTKGHLRFPPTGSLTKAARRPQQRPLFSSKKSPLLSVDDFFDDRPTESPTNSNADQFWRSDYDNIEYFEPIIIDIGDDSGEEKRRRTDFSGPKVEFKLKNFELKKSTGREPLRLPGKLHETVDRLSEALMHPPIFDVESEGNEPQAVILLVGNGIT